MDNAIHIKIEIVEFLAVGIWLGRIDRYLSSILQRYWLVLHHWRDYLRIFARKPAESCRNTHEECRDCEGSVQPMMVRNCAMKTDPA